MGVVNKEAPVKNMTHGNKNAPADKETLDFNVIAVAHGAQKKVARSKSNKQQSVHEGNNNSICSKYM